MCVCVKERRERDYDSLSLSSLTLDISACVVINVQQDVLDKVLADLLLRKRMMQCTMNEGDRDVLIAYEVRVCCACEDI